MGQASSAPPSIVTNPAPYEYIRCVAVTLVPNRCSVKSGGLASMPPIASIIYGLRLMKSGSIRTYERLAPWSAVRSAYRS